MLSAGSDLMHLRAWGINTMWEPSGWSVFSWYAWCAYQVDCTCASRCRAAQKRTAVQIQQQKEQWMLTCHRTWTYKWRLWTPLKSSYLLSDLPLPGFTNLWAWALTQLASKMGVARFELSILRTPSKSLSLWAIRPVFIKASAEVQLPQLASKMIEVGLSFLSSAILPVFTKPINMDLWLSAAYRFSTEGLCVCCMFAESAQTHLTLQLHL